MGQETYSWYGLLGRDLGDDPVGAVLSKYTKFDLGSRKRSPFWNAVRKLRRRLGRPDEPIGLAWSNLYPCDQNQKRPDEPLGESLLGSGTLPREVKILAPDAVVFLTGPHYDGAIRRLFPAVEFVETGAPPAQKVHRVGHPDLPAGSFRTYHPGYLNSSTVRDT